MIVYTLVACLTVALAVYFVGKGDIFRYFLFVVFVFNLLPSIINIRLDENSPEIKLSQIFVGVLLVWMVGHNRTWKLERGDRWTVYLLALLLAVRFISSFSSEEPALSLRIWFITLFGWFFFYYATVKLVENEKQVDQLLVVLLASAITVAAFNFFELFTSINLTQSEDFSRYERYGIPRVHGLLGDPVATAYYLLPMIPCGMYLYAKRKNALWLLGTMFIGVALLLNFSRITFISLALMIGGQAVLFSRKKFSYIIAFASVLMVVIFTDNVIRDSIADLFTEITGGSTSFDYVRTDAITSTALTMVEQVPVFGLGPGSLTRNELMSGYFDKVGYMYVETSIRTELPVFVTMSIECGILAGIIFIVVFLRNLKICFNLSTDPQSPVQQLPRYLFLSLLGYLICLTANGVTNSLNIFFVLIGLTSVLMKNRGIPINPKAESPWVK